MKKKQIIIIVFLISFFLTAAYNIYAECYNEEACFKDYVSHKGKDTVIAVNRDTEAVELYWSDKDNTWLKPDKEHLKALQKIYNKKIQLRQMQGHMDRMSRDTWYNKNESSGRSR